MSPTIVTFFVIIETDHGSEMMTCSLQNNWHYHVKARKEVILSGGTVNSPQLLMLSGIGPRQHLESMGIRVVRDLPGVGENLHNHASFSVDFTLNSTNVNELNVDSAGLYMYNQTGPMSSTGMAQVTGILCSNYTTADDPDIQIFFAGYQAICNTGGRIADLMTYDNKETVRFTSVNIQTLSRGRSICDPITRRKSLQNERNERNDETRNGLMDTVVIDNVTSVVSQLNDPDHEHFALPSINFRGEIARARVSRKKKPDEFSRPDHAGVERSAGASDHLEQRAGESAGSIHHLSGSP